MITDELIVKESGQYDKETIQHLRLESFGELLGMISAPNHSCFASNCL